MSAMLISRIELTSKQGENVERCDDDKEEVDAELHQGLAPPRRHKPLSQNGLLGKARALTDDILEEVGGFNRGPFDAQVGCAESAADAVIGRNTTY